MDHAALLVESPVWVPPGLLRVLKGQWAPPHQDSSHLLSICDGTLPA